MAKKLYLSKNKKIWGVCGGFAEYLDMDPTVVRLLYLLLLILTGVIPLTIFYIIAALVMPKK